MDFGGRLIWALRCFSFESISHLGAVCAAVRCAPLALTKPSGYNIGVKDAAAGKYRWLEQFRALDFN
jgi:hypothetical protein